MLAVIFVISWSLFVFWRLPIKDIANDFPLRFTLTKILAQIKGSRYVVLLVCFDLITVAIWFEYRGLLEALPDLVFQLLLLYASLVVEDWVIFIIDFHLELL